jgi:predicted dienelactone hydrolase
MAVPYTYNVEFPNMLSVSVQGHVMPDADPDLSGGPYPLVVAVHGHGAYHLWGIYLFEQLASRGFVVMSVQYQDNLGAMDSPIYASLISRPDDVTRQIDYASTMPDLIDIERVAVIGHSLGGYTALAAGGAQLDMNYYAEWCDGHRELDELGCQQVLDNLDAMAELAGLDTVPEGLWPSRGDSRVDVIVALSPGGRYLGPNGTQSVSVPTLLMGGSGDTAAQPEYNFYEPYTGMGSAEKTMVILENANHMFSTNSCDEVPLFAGMGFFEYCSDEVWDMDRAHDLTNHFVTAFLLAQLYEDADAAAALAPDAVTFPGVRYETTVQ